jgi:hypothetical protein
MELVEQELVWEPKYILERNLPQCNFIFHKPHMGSNPACPSGCLGSNRLTYCMAQNLVGNKPFVLSF